MRPFVRLPNRGLLRVAGPTAAKFLNGLFTQDVVRMAAEPSAGGCAARYGCFLNNKGRVLFDGFVVAEATAAPAVVPSSFLVDVDARCADTAADHLAEYCLDDAVTVSDVSSEAEVRVALVADAPDAASFGGEAMNEGSRLAAVLDARTPLATLVRREYTRTSRSPPAVADSDLSAAVIASYEATLLRLGVVEGRTAFPTEGRALPFEANVDGMGGISFQKGCYLGQELTHRTHVMLVVRKRFVPVVLDTNPCAGGESDVWGPVGSSLRLAATAGADAPSVGTLVARSGKFGVASMRLRHFSLFGERLEARVVTAGGAAATAVVPDWWPAETIGRIIRANAAGEAE